MSNSVLFLEELPDPESARRFLVQFAEKHPSHEKKLLKNNALLSDVLTLVAYSPLLAATMLQHPEYIGWLQRKRGESVLRNKDELLESLARFSLTNSQIEPHILLSRFRRRELLRIYLRDIRRLATIAEITEEISNLADAILEHALRLARQELDNRYGPPQEMDDKGRQRPAEICIVSLGKLGSRELNYSSDIDLLFIYSDEGTTAGVGTRDPITNREYFIKLAETITKLAGEQTGEGAAYRVDLRLRPQGRVGPLAMSLKDSIDYYRNEAAAWERQVLIRSRASAGHDAIFKQFASAVEARVFSAEITVEEALRNVSESKQKIDLENINSKAINVKLGRGGIREIEFIAQALQLAYGGRDKWLRVSHTLISLSRLADRKLLTEHELSQLSDAYAFLRQLEHILQMENGLQTHAVPNDDSRREVVARRMNRVSLAYFDAALKDHTDNVSRVFHRVFGSTQPTEQLAEYEPERPDIQTPEISGKTAGGNGEIFRELSRSSPRLAGATFAGSEVLGSLGLDRSEFPDRDYQRAMSEAVHSKDDLGHQLASLRKTWQRHFLEIIAFDALGKLSIKQAKHLQTTLAEASIETALAISRNEIGRRYSVEPESIKIAVMGLGKLGGAGVDYDSDLDLVMVYDDAVSNPQSATRAVEIFVNALSAMTRDGSLYRVDLRLRPHGKDGALAISRSSFADYIKNNAVIWEMLAFVKLRGVGGDIELASAIGADIRELIFEKAKNIPPDKLAEETLRIRTGLEMQRTGPLKKREIDIKYGSGGMLDIYFAIRFLQLRDNVRDDTADRSTARTLEMLRDSGSLNLEQFQHFKNGYDFLSALDHYLRLTVGRSTRLPQANHKALSLVAERMKIASSGELLENLTAHRLDIRHTFDSILSQNRER